MSDTNVVTLNVYKSRIPSVNYSFKDGHTAPFNAGVFRTSNANEIAELDAEIKNGHPHLYVDPAEATVASNMVDPMAQLRARIIAEYKASEAAAIDPTNDMGNTNQEQVKPASTADIASGAAGGDGGASSATLSALSARLSAVKVDSSTGQAAS